jgi:UDP-glucose 4-epimerase
MRILVTGALGHIGSRLIRSLSGICQDLILIDDLSTQRYCSLFDLPPDVRYRFHQLDVRSPEIAPLFEGVDVVVHLAAVTDAEGSVSIPERVEQVNSIGTENVARICAEQGCRLIFLSTTSVYGPQTDVVDEACPSEALRPQSPYAESKLRAEGIVASLEGLRYVVLRFGTIFGPSPGMRFHTAVNKFLWQAIQGLPLTVWKTALDQRRPYLDLDDAVRSLEFVIAGDRFDRTIYNVVTTNATVRDIVEVIREVVGGAEITFVDSPIMNQLSYTVSANKFESLGFEFRGDLRRSLSASYKLLSGIARGLPASNDTSFSRMGQAVILSGEDGEGS